ncbi:D-alanyl-D-alanine carboxypeptidase/D-alanyl-D-alanine endopeptidase [Geoanaerobacter pelophilus]|nr:D-alanyl-D-alanine carboxypeptidase/D-alanyl-D-alanine-endopeptidase [Geoanaerobacter pelophilus]
MSHLCKTVWVVLSLLIIAAGSPVAAFAGPTAPPVRAESGVPGDSTAHLKKEIDGILSRDFLPATTAGIKVVSLTHGDTIYEFNPRLLLVPASTQKVFTAAAALSVLGPEREVATTVVLDAAAARIYLKGCGDSLLSAADLTALASAAAQKMGKGKEYALAADLSCFDDLYRGMGWMWDDDEMMISPLSVNHNAVSVLVQPGPKAGAPAVVSAEPRTPYYTLENLARTGSAGDTNSIQASRRPGERENVVTVTGAIASGSSPVVRQASVWRPELMALALFRDALRAQGIKVTTMTTAPAPVGATEVARTSRRLEELVRFALKTSDNVTAESLLKLLGLHATGKPGSAEAGSVVVRGYLAKQGIAKGNVVVADGSGLSRYNLSSAETMIQTLRAIYRDPLLYRVFQESLPVAGKDGTLKNRMKGSCAEGKVRGKTGNMKGLSSLAGYATSADGEPLAFSIMIQNYAVFGGQAREFQDRIAKLLCGFRRTK